MTLLTSIDVVWYGIVHTLKDYAVLHNMTLLHDIDWLVFHKRSQWRKNVTVTLKRLSDVTLTTLMTLTSFFFRDNRIATWAMTHWDAFGRFRRFFLTASTLFCRRTWHPAATKTWSPEGGRAPREFAFAALHSGKRHWSRRRRYCDAPLARTWRTTPDCTCQPCDSGCNARRRGAGRVWRPPEGGPGGSRPTCRPTISTIRPDRWTRCCKWPAGGRSGRGSGCIRWNPFRRRRIFWKNQSKRLYITYSWLRLLIRLPYFFNTSFIHPWEVGGYHMSYPLTVVVFSERTQKNVCTMDAT